MKLNFDTLASASTLPVVLEISLMIAIVMILVFISVWFLVSLFQFYSENELLYEFNNFKLLFVWISLNSSKNFNSPFLKY